MDDPMEIDSIVYVPDTPDRLLAARNTKFKNSIDVPDSPDTQVVGDKVNSSNGKDRIGMRANVNGIRKHCMGPPRSHHGSSSDSILENPRSHHGCSSDSILGKPRSHHGSSSDSILGKPISKISFVSKRHDFPSHNQSARSETIQNGVSNVSHEGFVEDPKGKKVVVSGGSQIMENGKRLPSDKGKQQVVSIGGSNIVESRKNFLSAAELHSQQSFTDSRPFSRINIGTGNSNKVSAFDRGTGAECNAVASPPRVGQFVSAPVSSPRHPGQRRLVRNGCISPCNVAKAQKYLGKDKNGGTIDEGSSRVSSSRTQASSVLNKGKGIIPLPNEESGGQNANNDRDNTVSIHEILEDDNDDSSIGILRGGWRTTHNRSKKTTHTSSSSEEPPLHPVDHSSTLISGDTSPLPLRHRLRLKSQPNQQNNEDRPIMDMNRKRQKQGGSSSSSTQDAQLQNTSNDSGIVFLGSSGDNTIESRPTRTRRRNNNNVTRAIELDEANSGVRANGGSNGGASSSSNNSVDPAMARQLEADEILARELQEQLYHEDLGLRFGEIDVHERLDLQHENVPFPPPRRTRQASTARTVPPTANPSRPPRARNTRPSVSVSRSTNATRALLHDRMRMRNHFPGRPRTISASSSRDVDTLFPSGMDVEMRMTILQALEEINDIGVDNSFLDIHREFNENDYEMLLGLDENNHRHSGASNRQINDLPQTILQSDLEEACAVCLETPATGETIRHLPCFHKFHKDCIDPWLTRKSSCPVCKNSIT